MPYAGQLLGFRSSQLRITILSLEPSPMKATPTQTAASDLRCQEIVPTDAWALS